MARPEHLIVVMLENRSFDHVLGYLAHPAADFDGARNAAGNVHVPGGPLLPTTSDGDGSCAVGPNHSHRGAMAQLFGPAVPRPPRPNNSGFVMEHEAHALHEGAGAGLGPEVLNCVPPSRVPCVTTLALEFAVCDRWFCSVPGETWPNRNFAHAATSDGEVNIAKRYYTNRTVFEELGDARREWAIYHQGFPQALVFPKLWDVPLVRNHFKKMERLFDAIEDDKLPHYAFVEPRHFGRGSNSQHPGNNVGGNRDFVAGDVLVGRIYEALRASPSVFERTLLVVTYDEHGGYYDHVPPPSGAYLEDGHVWREGAERFTFDLLGPRVPGVLVSPFIGAGRVDHREYDHASISATLRELFGLGAAPPRTRRAASFLDNVSSEAARRGDELPDLSRFLAAGAASFDGAGAADDVPLVALDEFQQSLVELAAQVDVRLDMEDAMGRAGPAAARMAPVPLEWMPLPGDPTGAMVPAAVAPAGAAAAYSEAVAERLLASTPQTIRLRTPRGESIDEPSRAQIERALDYALAGGADVSTWAADQEDRSVTVRGDNVVQLRLPDAGVRAERSLRSAADALQLIDLLRAGDIATLRAQF